MKFELPKHIYVYLKGITLLNSLLLFLLAKPVCANDLHNIVINLGWQHQFEFAGFYAAKELGYYKEAGLNIEFYEDAKYSFPKYDEFDYFVVSASRFLEHPDREDYIVVATIFQQSPLALLIKKDSTIKSLKDLYGKKLTVGSEIRAMLRAAGLDLSKIKLYENLTGIENLAAYDGITYYINDIFLGGRNTEKYQLFRPIEYGINFYGECLVATKEVFQKNPLQLEKIRVATLRGWQYAMENPREIATLIHEKYNSDLSLSQLMAEAEIVRNSLVLPELYEIGTSDRNKWVSMNNILMKQGIVTTPLEVDEAIYSPEINKAGNYFFWIKVILFVLPIAFGFAILVQIHNMRLKKEVQKRTLELANSNEKLESFNKVKNRIIAIISHDVRGPINRVSSLLDLYCSGDLTSEEIGPLFNRLGADIEEVRLLLDNLLLWSGKLLDKGKLEVAQENLEVEKLIDKIIHLYDSKIKEKEIKVTKNIASNTLKGDENIVSTLLRNLIVNAIKYTPHNGEIVIQCQKNCKGEAIFSIRDNGKGMDEYTKNKLFNSSIKSLMGSKGEKGNGFGLFLCKGLIEMYEGDIWVESELGIGSSFHFSIPNA